MDIRILQLVDGAKQAEGVTVIIDVFRAFSLESYLMSQGAETILPIGDLELAYKLKQAHPDWLLAGERGGKILPGFDMANSPTDLMNGIDVAGKTIVHTTSAGTQGISNASRATTILCGALVNAKATAEYIRSLNPGVVSLVCMGLSAVTPTEEDTLCAQYIKSLLEDKPIPLGDAIEYLKRTSGAKFFDKSKNTVFPEMDFHHCTQVDKFPFALRIDNVSDGIARVVKVNVL